MYNMWNPSTITLNHDLLRNLYTRAYRKIYEGVAGEYDDNGG
jgi:hypothetical protein